MEDIPPYTGIPPKPQQMKFIGYGFEWENRPYKLSSYCSDEDFRKYWLEGWSDGNRKLNNRSSEIQQPYRTVYSVAYKAAFRY